MMQRLLVMGVVVLGLCQGAIAQGTKRWTVDRYDDLARGTSQGVAIRSDGRLEAGPATSLVDTTGGSFVWSLASDASGNAYAGLGGTASGSAEVLKITPDGKSSKLFSAKELGVQALLALPDGSVLAATSPDGKVYRIARDGSSTVLFDPAQTAEKPKYLWDLASIHGEIFVATGAPAAVYRIPQGGKPELLFRTTDQHIRCLLATADGILWAGSDGAGVIYKIKPSLPNAKPFAVYAAPKTEITALAADSSGNIYAAAVGTKTATPLPPLPVTGTVGVTVTFVQSISVHAAKTNTLVPEGTDIYRIAADGAPSKLLTLSDDVVYALTYHKGSLLAATGNSGKIYRIDTGDPGRFTDLAHLDAADGMAFAPAKDGLFIATSNSGKIYRMRDRLTAPATYTSSVFDAGTFSRWGRAEIRSDTPAGYDLYLRSGNTQSPLMGWSDWTKVPPGASTADVPPSRFAQWKVVLRQGATVDSVALNYLEKNIAPVVDQVMVQPGARVANTSASSSNTTVQISFPKDSSSASAANLQQESTPGPLSGQKDKDAVTIRWEAHDPNGDTLRYSIFYKGLGEANWRLLKKKVTQKFYSFDASLLPDGRYLARVVASDAPTHTAADTLTGEKTSDAFTIDTTPPLPGPLTATIAGNRIHAVLEVKDATSPIARAEYSVDAQPWQYLEPVGGLSDSQTEHYDFFATIPMQNEKLSNPKEHVIAVRVYDRFDNVASVKAVVRE